MAERLISAPLTIQRNNPDSLTLQTIQQIGINYTVRFSRNTQSTLLRMRNCLFHHNHHHALALRHCPEDLSAKQKWDYLLNIYKQLPNANGYLAREIEYLFARAFNLRIEGIIAAGRIYVVPIGTIIRKFQDAIQNTYPTIRPSRMTAAPAA